MRSKCEQPDWSESTNDRDLRVLTEVEADPTISQRELSSRLGIALGLTNMLVRNLVKKGYVRASQAGWKRKLYALTPEGFSLKIRLTTSYIRRFLDHYQRVRQTLREQLAPLALHRESRVAIWGTGEFAELIFLGLRELGIEEIEVFGPTTESNERFLGMPVQGVAGLQIEQYDRVLIATENGSQVLLDENPSLNGHSDKLVVFFGELATKSGA
jgi:DNA-binding MarR family transcriptional regulator